MNDESFQDKVAPGDETKEKRYKRPFDLTILVLVHLLLLPVWFLLWTLIPVAIWLEDRGPIFYTQNRIGRSGRRFRLVKFRTMQQSLAQVESEPTILAVENDPRITRVGRILRRTALDELPQVLNIVAGHMSLVGPRPEPFDIQEQLLYLLPDAHIRLMVRPGLTGLAQLYGGYHAQLRDKLRLDLLYIRKMSLWTDVSLLVLSVWNTLLAKWQAA